MFVPIGFIGNIVKIIRKSVEQSVLHVLGVVGKAIELGIA